MSRFKRLARFGMVLSVGCCTLVGCGQGGTSEVAAVSAAGAAASNATEGNDEVARAAADFLDAVLKGDTQRANARLTPQAIERINASGSQLDPPGLDGATFRIGEVRAPAPGQALVQCMLTDTTSADGPRSEEMCCLMRLVEGEWRVSGIAYGHHPDQPWTLSNFETGQNMSIPRPSPAPEGSDPADRPSPRTAHDGSPAAVR